MKPIKVLIHWYLGQGLGLQGKFYNKSKREWQYVSNPPSTMWEAFLEMKTSKGLACTKCEEVFFERPGWGMGDVWGEYELHEGIELSGINGANQGTSGSY